MSYLKFLETDASPSGKTKRWYAFSGDCRLALIAWYAPWRKYTSQFNPDAVFDCSCLREIADFCEAQTREHKLRS